MPRAKLSDKQAEIKKLLDAGQDVDQIADLTDTTPNAIKAQISRMRKNGHSIPRVPRRAATVAAPTPTRSASEGASVEQHIASELTAVDHRLSSIDETLLQLNTEHRELTERRERLLGAQGALSPEEAAPRLAAVN